MRQGFTLIELAIVLVIIGLIVGGVLVGKSMIEASAAQATISQINRYNQAVGAFRLKYECLPGDCANAEQYGFQARGQFAGEGDGNGVLEGVSGDASGRNNGFYELAGETAMFWVDLSTANLIDGGFNTANSIHPPGGHITGATVDSYLPRAKLGNGNYIYVYSYNGVNYYGLSSGFDLTLNNTVSFPEITVQQAYNIDKKIDDGLPQNSGVTALYLNFNDVTVAPVWAASGPWAMGASGTAATAGTNLTCYDNGNVAGATQQYSLGQNGGSGMNCALSFRFQ